MLVQHCSPTATFPPETRSLAISLLFPRPWPAKHAELCFASAMPVTDEEAALAAVATLHSLSPEQTEALDGINAILHNGEPFVDVHELFALYNLLYFRKLLLPRVEVIWSPRLTLVGFLCASQLLSATVSSTTSEAGLVSGPLPHTLLDWRVRQRLTIDTVRWHL